MNLFTVIAPDQLHLEFSDLSFLLIKGDNITTIQWSIRTNNASCQTSKVVNIS